MNMSSGIIFLDSISLPVWICRPETLLLKQRAKGTTWSLQTWEYGKPTTTFSWEVNNLGSLGNQRFGKPTIWDSNDLQLNWHWCWPIDCVAWLDPLESHGDVCPFANLCLPWINTVSGNNCYTAENGGCWWPILICNYWIGDGDDFPWASLWSIITFIKIIDPPLVACPLLLSEGWLLTNMDHFTKDVDLSNFGHVWYWRESLVWCCIPVIGSRFEAWLRGLSRRPILNN